MCGFLVAPPGTGSTRLISRRGPDADTTLRYRGLVFEHFLLNVTGPPTLQPFTDGSVVLVYNGEIYNHPYQRSDGEVLLDLYQRYGASFPQELDGEFAIAVYDFGRDRAYFVTDRFATKPLWRQGIACASYESGVGGHKIPANRIEAVELSTSRTVMNRSYHDWDWRQRVTTYEPCVEAFVTAVQKRAVPRCFIGLSSGYDSGAIACALGDVDFKAYLVLASEDRDVLASRQARLSNTLIVPVDRARQAAHLKDHAEEFSYAIEYDHGTCRASYKDDYAAQALSAICEVAVSEGRKVYLSGTGADEILSDYSLIPTQSHFKGRYPDVLTPWPNFVDSCQYSYLGKEECVGGSWGIETRYPFLDTAFVQAFLSLTPALKNAHYKAPLLTYLTAQDFPFAPNTKIGWSV